jgi:hypothetical protein
MLDADGMLMGYRCFNGGMSSFFDFSKEFSASAPRWPNSYCQ